VFIPVHATLSMKSIPGPLKKNRKNRQTGLGDCESGCTVMNLSARKIAHMTLVTALMVFISVLFISGQKLISPVLQKNQDKGVKYVFLFIGDGLALPQIHAAEMFSGAAAGDSIPHKLSLSQFPVQGITTTYASDSLIPDSAAAATAIACGQKTSMGVIGMDSSRNNGLTSIAELARDQGMRIGIISNVALDNATPACFYAHQPSRDNYYEISRELIDSGFDYFAGGHFTYPRGINNSENDILHIALEKGYTIVNTRQGFERLNHKSGRVIVFTPVGAEGSTFNYEIDRTPQDISLDELTQKGIELLVNPNGFLLVIEGGKIDGACHAHDALTAIKEVLAFDAAVAQALQFYKEHPRETLIVVTGDHECGGMTLGCMHSRYSCDIGIMEKQTISHLAFNRILRGYKEQNKENKKLADLYDEIEQAFGLKVYSDAEMANLTLKTGTGDTNAALKLKLAISKQELDDLNFAYNCSMSRGRQGEEYKHLFGENEPLTLVLTQILNRKAGIGWTTFSHTGLPVNTFAIGVGCETFGGYYDNTDIYKKIRQVTGI
jgi:alkaline phosphatase